MSNGPVIPEAPASWKELAGMVVIILTLLSSITSTIVGGCNASKINTVQNKQNTQEEKLDVAAKAATDAKVEAEAVKQATAVHTSKIESKLETLSSKADTIKSAVDKPK